MFAGVRAGVGVTRAWDEFDARAVPEPAGVGLILAAGAACLRRPVVRLRRRATGNEKKDVHNKPG